MDIYQVDAFCRGPFTGNPAAVIPLEEWIPDDLMQQIAEENNLSETAFFVREDNGYHIRWMTPVVEVDLCGHATLATAYVIFEVLKEAQDEIVFSSRSGPLTVRKIDGLLELDFPSDPIEHAHHLSDQLGQALGHDPKEVWRGRSDFMCVFDRREIVEHMSPNFELLKLVDSRGVIVTAPDRGELDFVSRAFFPQAGINEDPVTGSAHTTLAPYWSKRLDQKMMEARQLSARKGYLKCEYLGERTKLSGTARLYLAGQIFL
jgi:phenazine biosynthesis protein PhzF family